VDSSEVLARLKLRGLYDGVASAPASSKDADDAMMAFFREQHVPGGDWGKWNTARRVIAAGQLLCRIDGIEAGDIDGYMGPQTKYAFEVYDARKATGTNPVPDVETWRDKPQPEPPAPVPAAASWPKQSGVTAFYGAVGTNQTKLAFAYPMRIAWNKRQIVNSTSCHKKVEPAMKRIFARAFDHYGHEKLKALGLDLFGGCLNVRKMRGGSAWSMHSWGIALDLDPERNQLKWGKDRAEFAKPAYVPFWEIVESEGAVSLGRVRDFDWMHFQFARL